MRKIILGTDWWTDCDDMVAVRLLARAHLAGEIRLIGIVLNAYTPDSVASLAGFLANEGLTDIPIAADTAATDFTGIPHLQKDIVGHLNCAAPGAPFEEPVPMLRRLLASADEKVELVEIGFAQCLAALLESGPDSISALDGISLVREKVKKLWMMAGNYQDESFGSEHNFNNNPRSIRGGVTVCEKWPTKITFLGWEAGDSVITGSHLDEGDLLKFVLDCHGSPNGRSSWDPMTVDLCLIGDADAAGYDTVRGRVHVNPDDGSNSFVRDEAGPHEYVKKRHPDSFYAARIDAKL